MAESITTAAAVADSIHNPDVLGQLREMAAGSSKRAAYNSENNVFNHGQVDGTMDPPLYAPLYAQKPEENSRPQIPGLTMVTMEEFDAEMKEKEKENNGHASKKLKLTSPSPAAEPVLLISKQKSAWVAKLNHIAQVHHLTTAFVFKEEAPHSYSASLTLLDGEEAISHFATSNTLFKSKKDAKEAVAEQAFVHLTDNPPAAKPKPTGPVAAEVDKSENWMGLLMHFVQTCALPYPDFNDYQQGTNALFSTTCTLQLPANIGGAIVTFGDTDKLFPSKKASKMAAAKEAVTLLRDYGALPKSGTNAGLHTPAPVAKKAELATISGPNPPISAPVEPFITPAPTTTFPVPNTGQATDDLPVAEPSTTKKILTLCKVLGLAEPTYCYDSDPMTPSFFSCAAYFPGEPDLMGPIGHVKRVFGKKAARGQCAKSVLERLEALKAERLLDF